MLLCCISRRHRRCGRQAAVWWRLTVASCEPRSSVSTSATTSNKSNETRWKSAKLLTPTPGTLCVVGLQNLVTLTRQISKRCADVSINLHFIPCTSKLLTYSVIWHLSFDWQVSGVVHCRHVCHRIHAVTWPEVLPWRQVWRQGRSWRGLQRGEAVFRGPGARSGAAASLVVLCAIGVYSV